MKIYNELEFLGFFEWLSETHNLKDTDMTPEYLDELPLNDIHRTVCNSIAFRWFREKYKLSGLIEIGTQEYSFFIFNENKDSREVSSNINGSYEETELECVKKLIEIIS